MPSVSKIKVEGNLKEAIQKAVGEIARLPSPEGEANGGQGGFANFIKTGDVVLLKPNFNTADPYPASTDLEFLKTIIGLVYAAGAKLVIVGDSCTMTLNARKVMENLKIFDLQNMEPAPRIEVFEDRKWIRKEVPGGQYLKTVSTPEILDRIDKLILLPCLKTHFQAKFTGSLKLSVAFMKPYQRVALHMRNIQEKIAELNKVINPVLVVMDARKCFINNGPSHGDVREPDLIMASESRVAIDIEGIKIIQSYKGNSIERIKPEDLPQIKRAMEIGIP